MLRYWHVSLLVLIALIWKIRPTTANMDVCESTSLNVSMYCNCDPLPKEQMEITCFTFGPIERSSNVWRSFIKYDNTVSLTFKSRLPYKLNYVPTRVLQSLPSIERFTIQGSELGSLESNAISNMPKLKELWLDGNELTSLERESIRDLPKLQKLTLSENRLTEILADTFSNLDELELLFLDANNISRIEGCAFCNLHNLKELELWRNSITDLTEHTFRGLRYLSRLDLYNNHLSVINDNVFQSMPKLRELNLKSNKIHYISPRAFEGLNQLGSLYLNNNLLKSLPPGLFRDVPMMMVLDMSYNQFETITSELMDGLRNRLSEYFTFYLKGNPLKCSCDFSWVQTYTKKSRSKLFVKELSQMTCVDHEGIEKEIQSLRLKECVRKTKKISTVPPIIVSAAKEASRTKPKENSGQERKLDKIGSTEPITVHTAVQDSPPGGGSSGSIVFVDLIFLLVTVTISTFMRT